MFKKATKKQAKLKMAIMGPSGSGKTYTSLKIATGLGQTIAVIDTEYGSASKYADEFDFDTVSLTEPTIDSYVSAINEASKAGYEVLIIDSMTHAWEAILELVDQATKRSKSKNSYFAWGEGTPEHKRFINAILKSSCHVIATIRSKTEYVTETDSRGKVSPRKVGMAPIQRAGVEYEFDIVAEMDIDNTFMVSKTRCKALNQLVVKHADGVTEKIKAWLDDGEEVEVKQDMPAQNVFINKTDALEKLLHIIKEKNIAQGLLDKVYEKTNSKDLSDLPLDKINLLINSWGR